ncbi:PREDICTED: UDP-glycosyltransferase 75B1 [Brassica oleracea var. oleracea]|uniref:Glycosyltransferase n=1 Tax=Brassica oleracea var. oleracea TaxID=109376 RepID=A0A0D3C7V5_BRAOL|nr:PREDICTED: UDP-glycosyltransferase 75B1 [Brassica oleracea var. oleracea]
MAPPPHFLLVTYPAQGHVNPSLHFARRLIRTTGARVTFVTCVSVFHRSMISKHSDLDNNLSFLAFSDGFDQGGLTTAEEIKSRSLNLKNNGEKALSEFIEGNKNGDSPVTCLVYTMLLNWAPKVASRFQLPSALLWIQPALVFNIYYNHFNGHNNSSCLEFKNLSSIAVRDLPSFLTPANTNQGVYNLFQELMELLIEETNPKILVNTFDSLEQEALKALPRVGMVAVGPLLPSEMFTESVRDLSNDQSSSYSRWLDSKTESSVIYVSFGTMVELSRKQIGELARALIEGKRPFLWVITDKSNREAKLEGEDESEIEKIAGFRHELEEVGMIVSWCSQVEVLRHRAVGCFVTHCGWSSTLESLVLGVPVVAFPMWSDQPTTAKLLEELWRTGVRVRENEEGLVERGEIRRCLEAVMDEKLVELRENAEDWRRLAVEAGREGGSCDKNIEAFVDEILLSVAEEVKDKDDCSKGI